MSENQHNETPTPRTDAQLARVSTLEWRDPPPQVNADFARELERECAELRQTCSDLRHQLAARKTKAQQYCDEINALLLERDAALSRERRLREACEGLLDGLDANSDEQGGLTHDQWLDAIRAARAAMAFDGREDMSAAIEDAKSMPDDPERLQRIKDKIALDEKKKEK